MHTIYIIYNLDTTATLNSTNNYLSEISLHKITEYFANRGIFNDYSQQFCIPAQSQGICLT